MGKVGMSPNCWDKSWDFQHFSWEIQRLGSSNTVCEESLFLESEPMRQVPLERDINIAVNGCSGFATSTQKLPFMAMLISRSRGTYLIRLRTKYFLVASTMELSIHNGGGSAGGASPTTMHPVTANNLVISAHLANLGWDLK